MIRTVEQDRACEAWDALELRLGGNIEHPADERFAKSYLTAMRQTATRVHVSGLGQAIAFLRSRSDTASRAAADDLCRLVLQEAAVAEGENSSVLLHRLQTGDLLQLMLMTEEVMGLIAWFSYYLQGAGIEAGDALGADDDQGVQEDEADA